MRNHDDSANSTALLLLVWLMLMVVLLSGCREPLSISDEPSTFRPDTTSWPTASQQAAGLKAKLHLDSLNAARN